MKAITNKSTKFCACSLIKGLQGRGRSKYTLTNADYELMAAFEDSLAKFCIVSKSKCIEPGLNGEHTKIAMRYVSHCRRCSGDKWEVVLHPPLESSRSPLPSRGVFRLSHLIPLPIPHLHIPTPEEITDMNHDLRFRHGDWDEDGDND